MLKDFLNLKEKDILSIVGSGGKTTTMYCLARELKGTKVLLTTSTKIKVDYQKDFIVIKEISELLNMDIKDQIYLSGNTIVNNKFTGILEENLLCLKEKFEYILIESDGSRNLPLKGWRYNEPVILNGSNKTLGIIPIDMLGAELDKIDIFERDLFLDIVGKDKRNFDVECIYKIAISRKGIFKNTIYGEKYLLLNKCDNENLLFDYKKIKNELEKYFLPSKDIKIIIGSSIKGKYYGD